MKYKIRNLVWCLLCVILLVCIYQFQETNDSAISDEDNFISQLVLDENGLYGKYEVISVVDGDTFDIRMNHESYRIRLIGVDTPESVASELYLEESGKENTEIGEDIADYVRTLLEFEYVYLEFDEEIKDSYGRILAYVYLDDGITMVNRILLECGYATVMRIPPNTKYSEEFSVLESIAQREQIGIWKD